MTCGLGAAAFEERGERWRRVLRSSQGTEARHDGVRVLFQGSSAVRREIAELVEAESSCCGWASWTVSEAGPGVLVLDARSGDPAGVTVLHNWFAVSS